MVTKRKSYWLATAVFLVVVVGLINYHWQKIGLPLDWRMMINVLSFGWIMGMLLLAHTNPEYEATPREIKRFNVAVIVPVYNEDPATFLAMLDSLEHQSRKPETVVVVDDGSQTGDCYIAFRKWKATTTIPATYIKQVNSGKREAQAKAFRATPEADIYVTLDSDTVLDELALENGIKPFARHQVMSVAGLLLGLNDRANLLTRLVDIGFVTSFLNGRAAWSHLHSVAVNCGGLAFYRASIVRKYLDEYLNHTIRGKRSTCGDDRMLTNFALLDGWTVFQENSIGYTLLPVNMKHLTKQRIRWWRSFFWGSEWLIRRFAMNRLVWWLVAWQLVNFVMYTIIVPVVLLINPLVHQHFPTLFFLYLFVLSYVRNVRYLQYKRPDQAWHQQYLTYLLSPLSNILHFYLCTVLQYVGLATYSETGWSTRSQVEVGISTPQLIGATK